MSENGHLSGQESLLYVRPVGPSCNDGASVLVLK